MMTPQKSLFECQLDPDGTGYISGPSYLLRPVVWPHNPYFVYEPGDEIWGLYFGFCKYRSDRFTFEPGDAFDLERFIPMIRMQVIVTSAKLLSLNVGGELNVSVDFLHDHHSDDWRIHG